MKKRTMLGIGAGLLVGAVAAAGCRSVIDEDVETVYGPPIDFSEDIEEIEDDDSRDDATDYADEIEDIYGPPVMDDYEDDWSEEEEEEIDDTDTSLDEDPDSEIEVVYGPPPAMIRRRM